MSQMMIGRRDTDIIKPNSRPFRKLEPKAREELIQAVQNGVAPEIAVHRLGIRIEEFRDWAEWVERQRELGRHDQFTIFFDDLDRAAQRHEESLVTGWNTAAQTDWRAADAFLTKRYPERWSEKKQIDVNMDARVMIYLPDNGRSGPVKEVIDVGTDPADGE